MESFYLQATMLSDVHLLLFITISWGRYPNCAHLVDGWRNLDWEKLSHDSGFEFKQFDLRACVPKQNATLAPGKQSSSRQSFFRIYYFLQLYKGMNKYPSTWTTEVMRRKNGDDHKNRTYVNKIWEYNPKIFTTKYL